jgi:hypothetical protein
MHSLSVIAPTLGALICLWDGWAVKSRLLAAERVWESDGLRTSFIRGKGLVTKVESRLLDYPQMPEVVRAHQRKVISGIYSKRRQLIPRWGLLTPALLYAPEAYDRAGVLILCASLLAPLIVRHGIRYFLRNRLCLMLA